MRGWIGKVLRVDLSGRKTSVEDLDLRWATQFVGGRGLATKYFLNEVAPAVDALDPRNKLILATGPLTGTAAPCGGRWMAVTKGALTGAIASSNSGGSYGPEIKYAGFDMIIVEGKSETPVYLWVRDGEAELRSAETLWGKTTHETEDLIRRDTDLDARVASIGPAGEKGVRFACIVNDKHRGAGRSGVGAVMGSKNLKAVAVRGSGGVGVARPEAFHQATVAAMTKLRTNPVTSVGLPTYGTALLVNIVNESGVLPTRNFQQGVFEGAAKISGERLAETLLVRNKACFACPVACGRVTRVRNPKYAGMGEGPEYESDWALGAACGVDDLEAITKANYLCNELGLDPISAGSTIACAMELFEKGHLTTRETGRPLEFGNADAMVEMVRLTALREGFGEVLAEGSRRMAEKYGHPELSMGVKGQEFPAYDPRGVQGMAVQYATSNRGACHVRGYMVSPEILGVPAKLDPLVTKDKASWDKTLQDLTAVIDSSGVCLFSVFAIGAPEYAALLEAATAAGYTEESLMLAGERIWNLERLFNLKAGFTAGDDTLPERLLREPMPAGPAKGLVARLAEMLPEYYHVRGWDDHGVPTPGKLQALGLQ